MLAEVFAGAEPYAGTARRVLVRINAAGCDHFGPDVAAVAPLVRRGAGIMLAKCGGGDLDALFESLPGLPGGAVIPLIETIDGFDARDGLLRHGRGRGLVAAAFGAGDMCLELGIERDYGLTLLQHVIAALALSAKVNGIGLIDAPARAIPSMLDPHGWRTRVEAESAWSFGNGLCGKLAVHPAQVPVIHAALDRSSATDWAQRVIADFERAPDRRYLASSQDGRYMGLPTLKQALALLRPRKP